MARHSYSLLLLLLVGCLCRLVLLPVLASWWCYCCFYASGRAVATSARGWERGDARAAMSVGSAAPRVAPGMGSPSSFYLAAAGFVGFLLGAMLGFIHGRADQASAPAQPLALAAYRDVVVQTTVVAIATAIVMNAWPWREKAQEPAALASQSQPLAVTGTAPAATTTPQPAPATIGASGLASGSPQPAALALQPLAGTAPAATATPQPAVPQPCPHDRVTSHGTNGTHIRIRCKVCGDLLFEGKK